MTARYFEQFPLTNYNGSNVVNIMERGKIATATFGNPYVFYPYQLSETDRPDSIADQYYDDPYFSWLVFFSNQTIDPYYGWYLSYADFNNFLVEKYGSIEITQQKAVFYRNNWYNDDSKITEDFYFNNLPPVVMKYWTAVMDSNDSVLYYQRAPIDWIVDTNMFIQFNVTYSDNTVSFANNEVVDIIQAPFSIGTGQVEVQNTSAVILKHITGNTTANGIILVGRESNCSATVGNSSVIQVNLDAEEFVYWEPVMIYDVENERNENNKTIRLIDNRFSALALQQLTQQLANN